MLIYVYILLVCWQSGQQKVQQKNASDPSWEVPQNCMEAYLKDYPTNSLSLSVMRALAKEYKRTKQPEKAKKVLLQLLKIELAQIQTKSVFPDTSKAYRKCLYEEVFTKHWTGGGIKYEACLDLYALEIDSKNYPQALKYLRWAETTYPAKSDCANGYYMWRMDLFLQFAKTNLLMRDTSKAMGRLLSCIIDNEGAPTEAMDLFRKISAPKYSKTQIEQAICKGIEQMGADYHIQVFGARVYCQKMAYSELGLQKAILRLQQHPYLHRLYQ
jgi:hypothetical protein